MIEVSYALRYDLKKSLSSKALIIAIILLILAGIGAGYLFSREIEVGSNYYFVSNFVSTNRTYLLEGYLISANGQIISNAKIFYNGKTAITNSKGFAEINLTGVNEVGVATLNFQLSNVNYTASITNMAVVNIQGKTGEVYASIYLPKGNWSCNIYYGQLSLSMIKNISSLPKELYKIALLNLSSVGEPILFSQKVNIEQNSSKPIVFLNTDCNSTQLNYTNYYSFTIPSLISKGLEGSALISSLTVFAEFFPLLGLFLINDAFVKPRSSKAIEFILSRPITKGQLFISRFTSGLIAMLISSIAAGIVIPIAVSYVLNASITYSYILFSIAALIISSISFYSLLYLIASISYRGFIGISIAFYLIFYLFDIFEILSFLTGKTWLAYISPYAVSSMILQKISTSSFSLLININYTFVTIAATLWIFLPAILSFFIYVKSDKI